jgi:hypothetical protein
MPIDEQGTNIILTLFEIWIAADIMAISLCKAVQNRHDISIS